MLDKEATFRQVVANSISTALNLTTALARSDVFFMKGSSPRMQSRDRMLIQLAIMDRSSHFGVHLIDGANCAKSLQTQSTAAQLSDLLNGEIELITSEEDKATVMLLEVEEGNRESTLGLTNIELIVMFVVCFVATALILATVIFYYAKLRADKERDRERGGEAGLALRTGNVGVYDLNSAAQIMKDENSIGVCPNMYLNHLIAGHGHRGHGQQQMCIDEGWVVPYGELEVAEKKGGQQVKQVEDSVDTKL